MEGGGEISSFYDKEEAILGIALILILVPSFIESPNRGFMVVCGDNVPFVGSTEAT